MDDFYTNKMIHVRKHFLFYYLYKIREYRHDNRPIIYTNKAWVCISLKGLHLGG